MPNPAGLIVALDRSAPSAPNAPPTLKLLAVDPSEVLEYLRASTSLCAMVSVHSDASKTVFNTLFICLILFVKTTCDSRKIAIMPNLNFSTNYSLQRNEMVKKIEGQSVVPKGVFMPLLAKIYKRTK